MSIDLNMDFHLPAPPERVMDMLLDAGEIRKWSGEVAEIERKEGGSMKLFDGWVFGTITKLTDNELAYTWNGKEWSEGTPASTVHYKLKKDNEGTKVALQHNNLPTQEEADRHQEGWEDQFFGLMEEYLWATSKK